MIESAPGCALVLASGRDDMLIGLAFVSALRPYGHERIVWAVEDKEVLVAGLVHGGVVDRGDKDNEIGVRAAQCTRNDCFKLVGRGDSKRHVGLLAEVGLPGPTHIQ